MWFIDVSCMRTNARVVEFNSLLTGERYSTPKHFRDNCTLSFSADIRITETQNEQKHVRSPMMTHRKCCNYSQTGSEPHFRDLLRKLLCC
jgi:hypothetical protein